LTPTVRRRAAVMAWAPRRDLVRLGRDHEIALPGRRALDLGYLRHLSGGACFLVGLVSSSIPAARGRDRHPDSDRR
jgi:hypothetical protein